MEILRAGYVLGLGPVFRESSNKGRWYVRLLLWFRIEVGGYRSRVLSKLSIWDISGGVWLMLRCGLIVMPDGHGWRTARSVLGIGLAVVVGRGLSPWALLLLLAGW